MTIGKLSGQCDFGQKGQSYCNQRGQSCVAKRVKVAWLFHRPRPASLPVMDLTQRGMQSIETDDILFEILNASAELKAALSGGIFVQGERPDNSGKEDVVINNLFLNHEVPQTGTSNVNIHVPDKKERIGRTEQFKAHRERIRELTAIVLSVLKSANITGLTIRVSTEAIIKEPGINEHYNNLRVEWNIQRTN